MKHKALKKDILRKIIKYSEDEYAISITSNNFTITYLKSSRLFIKYPINCKDNKNILGSWGSYDSEYLDLIAINNNL